MKIKTTQNNEPITVEGLVNNVSRSYNLLQIFENKQNTLVSGTNIKTVNDQSLLGSGNLIVGDHYTITPTTYSYIKGLLDGSTNKFVSNNSTKSYVIPVISNFNYLYIKATSTMPTYLAFSNITPTQSTSASAVTSSLIGSKVYKVNQGDEQTFSIPNGTSSIIIDGNNASGGSYVPEIFEFLTDFGYNVSTNTVFVNDYKFEGKTMSFLGDSITAYTNYVPSGFAAGYPMFDVQTVGQMWWKIVIDKLKMNLGVCNAYSGGGVSGTDDGIKAISMSRLQNMGNPDYILLQIGTNDCNADFGDFHFWYNKQSKTYDKTKFRDAYSFIVEKLLELYPAAKIICMTPLYRNPIGWENETGNNIYGYTMNDMCDSIKTIAAKYHCPCIDLSECGINANNHQTYLGDITYNHNQSTPGYDVHPKFAGMQLMADYIVKKLREL